MNYRRICEILLNDGANVVAIDRRADGEMFCIRTENDPEGTYLCRNRMREILVSLQIEFDGETAVSN